MKQSNYVYIESPNGTGDGRGLWTVGFFRPDGSWEPASDHTSEEAAANRVHWLNGGNRTQGHTITQFIESLLAAGFSRDVVSRVEATLTPEAACLQRANEIESLIDSHPLSPAEADEFRQRCEVCRAKLPAWHLNAILNKRQ